MSFNINWEIAEMFHEAVMKHEAQKLQTPEDWQKADDTMKLGKAEREQMQKDYEREYDTRHEMKRQNIIKDAGRRNFVLPTPFGRDKFDSDAIDRQAHREVQHDHLNDLQKSREVEREALERLQETAHQRDGQGDKLTPSFEKVAKEPEAHISRSPNRSR